MPQATTAAKIDFTIRSKLAACFNLIKFSVFKNPATQKKRPVAGANGPLNQVYAYATVSARWQLAVVLAKSFSFAEFTTIYSWSPRSSGSSVEVEMTLVC
jgi:hypothetical protein